VAPLLGVQVKLLAAGSLRVYTSSWQNWRRWTEVSGATLWPAKPLSLGLCMLSYLQDSSSESKVLGIHSAVCFFDRVFGRGEVSGSSLLKTVVKYCKKYAVRKGKEKEPLDYEKLVEIVSGVDLYNCDLVHLRDTAFLTTSWFGLGRYDDIANMRRKNVIVNAAFFQLNLDHSKGDRGRRGQSILVAANNGPVDPVKILRLYIMRMDLSVGQDARDDDHLFMSMKRVPRRGTVMIRHDIPVPYSTMRAAILRECVKVGIDIKKIGTHSCRIGGCSEMVRKGLDKDCPGLVQEQGRWKDERTKRLYSRHKVDDLLKVAQAFSGSIQVYIFSM